VCGCVCVRACVRGGGCARIHCAAQERAQERARALAHARAMQWIAARDGTPFVEVEKVGHARAHHARTHASDAACVPAARPRGHATPTQRASGACRAYACTHAERRGAERRCEQVVSGNGIATIHSWLRARAKACPSGRFTGVGPP
jgi:hypothetical protein